MVEFGFDFELAQSGTDDEFKQWLEHMDWEQAIP